MNQPLEIERKYLIAYPDTQALRPRCTAVYDMEQTYLLSAPGVTARVRRRVGEKEEFFHTEKERITARTHVERERTITREEYVSNVIGHQLGHAKGFVADARFAPHVRAYVFDDGFDRPVAGVWGCDPEVDAGRKAPPVAEVDLDGMLERVTDLMNNARPFAAAKKFAFSVSPFRSRAASLHHDGMRRCRGKAASF